MGKRDSSTHQGALRTLANASITHHEDTAFQARANGLTLRLEVLAPDLFRLRICQGKDFSELASWAVGARSVPAPGTVRFQQSSGRVSLQTPAGRFNFDLAAGAWKISD